MVAIYGSSAKTLSSPKILPGPSKERFKSQFTCNLPSFVSLNRLVFTAEASTVISELRKLFKIFFFCSLLLSLSSFLCNSYRLVIVNSPLLTINTRVAGSPCLQMIELRLTSLSVKKGNNFTI